MVPVGRKPASNGTIYLFPYNKLLMAALDSRVDYSNFVEAVQLDSNLENVTTLTELHARLKDLSDNCNDPEGSVFHQLTFDGTNPNPVFSPNRFKKDIGCDGRKITTYYRYAIKAEEHVVAAVEYACDSVPSLLLPAASVDNIQIGALYQGGFKAVGNVQFLRRENVTHIVNTAKSLGAFFPKFNKYQERAQTDLSIEVLELGWVDDQCQQLRQEVLFDALKFIHNARLAGGSVLIHCAQGRSRSGALSAAYVATVLGTPFLEQPELSSGNVMDIAMRTIKDGRRMAQPNASFEAQLRDHAQRGFFDAARVAIILDRPRTAVLEAAQPPHESKP